MAFRTTDLMDDHPEFEACEAGLRHFGGRRCFSGPVATLRCFEDNSQAREWLRSPGEGRVLVIDGGGSRRCALIGDQLAAAALANGWAGLVVAGCVRDVEALARLDIGVLALDFQPRRSARNGQGVRDVPLEILGARVSPGHWAYIDEDGVVFAQQPLPE